MKTRSGSRILKILCIAAVFVLMLTLCGCRTRITNNSEVNNVMYDDGGFMQEEYDSRREELDLTTAKKPVFTGLGNPEEEEEYEYGDDGEALEDYEPDDYEEEVDDSNPPQANTTGSNSTTGNRRIVKRTTTTIITVTLNPNGGKCKTKSIAVRNGGKYGILPTPTRDGYTFTGWFTKKDDDKGKKVTSSTKVSATKNHTLYAHWKEGEEKKDEDKKPTEPTTPTQPTEPEKPVEPEKPEEPPAPVKHKVTLDPNGGSGGGTIDVEEGGKYGSLPDAEWEDHIFDGWYTEADGGDRIKSDSTFSGTSDQTLYAHWTDDYYKLWSKDLKGAVDGLDSKTTYKIEDGDGGDFLQDSGLKKGEDDFDIWVFFGDKSDAQALYDDPEKNPDGKSVLVVPKKARSTGNKNLRLVYNLKVFDKVYAYGIDIGRAEDELGEDSKDVELIG